MTYAPKEIYQKDLKQQKDLLFAIVICYATVFLGLFGFVLHVILTVTQITSALKHTIHYRDPKRQRYLVGVFLYCCSLLFFGYLPQKIQGNYINALGVIWTIIIPMIAAIWYVGLTKQDAEEAEETEEYCVLPWHEDILDV